MRRVVVCVATTPYYQRGQARLDAALAIHGGELSTMMYQELPIPWPSHQDKPYGFKAYALNHADKLHAETLLWCDACILPVKDMAPLWERIERDGYWFSKGGWNNYEWTADSAYPDLFPYPDSNARIMNRGIPHVVATTFGLSLKHEKGRAFLDEYYRLASETRAFCGPWTNANAHPHTDVGSRPRVAPCGPPDVRGHRHDQSAASVIAWRLGFELTSPPEIFCYGRADEAHDPRSILLASGEYE